MSGINITVFDGKNAQQAAQRAEAAAKKAESIEFYNLKNELPAPDDNILPTLRPNDTPVQEGDFMEVVKGIYQNVDSTDLEVVKDKGRLWFDGNKFLVSVDWDLPDNSAKAKDWADGTYYSEQTSVRDGVLYRVKKSVTSTTGEPGVSEDWEVLGKVVDVVSEFGNSSEKAAAQKLVSESLPANISNHLKKIDGIAFLNTYLGKGLSLENEPTVFNSYTEARYTNYFDIAGVEKIRYIGNYGSQCAGMIFLDSDGQITSTLTKSVTGTVDVTIDKPVNAVTARASSLTSTIEVSFPNFGVNVKKFEEIDAKVGHQSVEYFKYDGYTRASDGAFIEQHDWRTTEFIRWEDFLEASIWGHQGLAVASIAYFYNNEQGAYLGSYKLGNTRALLKKEDLTPPLGTRFIKVTTAGNQGIFPQNTWVAINKIEGAREYSSHQVENINSRLASSKYMHMSFDDVNVVLKHLNDNADVFVSIFENPFLGQLKRLHDTYGMVFSLYCFNENPAIFWSIENTTSNFANEFAKNSHWLKFGFHSKNNSTNYAESTAWYAKTDYTAFVNAMYSITGTTDTIDRAVRLQNFAGNIESCLAMRDEPCGLMGLLTADDNRNSYYLTDNYIKSHDRFKDTENILDFFKSETRLESATITDISTFLAQYVSPIRANTAREMIMFTHEYSIYPQSGGSVITAMIDKIEACAQWALANGYSFDFPMNRI